MKNYTYGWIIENLGYKEINEDKYTENQIDMREFINTMSAIIKAAHCGWDEVQYKVMEHITNNDIKEYMVLCVGNHGERWIPIEGNSKGCNFSVLGENLW